MTTQELADQVRGNDQGRSVSRKFTINFTAAEIICEEPEHAMQLLGIPILTTGIVAVRDKSKARMETIAESHGAYCTEPDCEWRLF
jgi:hypothetical protein